MKYVIVALVVVIAGLFGGGYYFYNKTESLSEQLSTAQSSLTKAVEDVTFLKEKRISDQSDTLELASDIQDLKAVQYQTEQLLKSYGPRQNVVVAKPRLVEIKINNATEYVRQELFCATGGPCK